MRRLHESKTAIRRVEFAGRATVSALLLRGLQAAGDAEAKKHDRLRMELDTLKAEVCTRTTRAWTHTRARPVQDLRIAHARTHAGDARVLGAISLE